MTYRETLRRIVDDLIAPAAAEVDRLGSFPRKGVEELAGAGLLGLTVPAEYGGAGLGLREAADTVQQLSVACGSTALVVAMHYCAVAVLASADRSETLAEVAAGTHLSTLAFAEPGSGSGFWRPAGTAGRDGYGDDSGHGGGDGGLAGGAVVLSAVKGPVVSAGWADSYVWSSRPVAARGPMTLWLLPAGVPGLSVAPSAAGPGLRGAGIGRVEADRARVPAGALIGADGAGVNIALATALPWLLLLTASAGVGLMRSVVATAAGLAAGRPSARVTVARMLVESDRTRAHVQQALAAVEAESDRARLLVLQVKPAADESAAAVAELGVQACGDAVERRYRDARSALLVPPEPEAMLDFVGRELCGLPLLAR